MDERRKPPSSDWRLSRYLAVDTTVILGTCGSQWSVLAENLATGADDEELRLTLLDAETREDVEQSLLDQLAPLMSRAVGSAVDPPPHPVRRGMPARSTTSWLRSRTRCRTDR